MNSWSMRCILKEYVCVCDIQCLSISYTITPSLSNTLHNYPN